MYIPIAEPSIGKEELDAVTEAVKSGWISSLGKNILEFENKFAGYCDAKYGVATTSGTTALHLCLAAAGIGPGDEVLVPSLTFVATANAVVYTGAKPVFVDSDLETWNMDPNKIESKITKNTKAILPVHLYGHPADMKRILTVARKFKLLVFEDAAEAHGAKVKNKKVGSLGNAGCFSFFGNKIITTGEGGMVVTNNKNFADRMKVLRDYGISKKQKYYFPTLGFNYNMTNIQAAIGLAQLEKIDELLLKKRQIANLYEKYLSVLIPRIVLPPKANWAENIYWLYSILIPSIGKINRNYLISELKKVGVDSRPFFFPNHKYKRFESKDKCLVAEHLANTGINLPTSPNLDEEKIKYICANIARILN